MHKTRIALAAVTAAASTGAVVLLFVLYAAVEDLESALERPVVVANPVEAVTVLNPVETVTVANPVDEVRVTNIVETASPRDSSLYGYCFPDEYGGYTVSVVAFSGGIEKIVAQGTYADAATTEGLAREINDYYGGPLNFGTSSEECHHLRGWGS